MKNIHLIPTDKPSKLRYNLSNVLVFTNELYRDYGKEANQHIYITSEKEDFNENDYVITKDGRLVQVSYLLSKDLDGASKVVIASDPDLIADGVQAIDDEFLKYLVENPSCESVEVEDVYKTFLEGDKRGVSNFRNKYKIIIPKEEPKNPNNQEIMFHEEHKEYFYEDFIDGKFVTVWLGKDYIPEEEPKPFKQFKKK